MRTTRRAKQVLNRLLADRKVTQSGVEWLTIATDPFHDTEVTPTGYPDMNTCNSIAQCFTYTKTVTGPTGGTTNWDAHVFLNPRSRNISEFTEDFPMDGVGYYPRQGRVDTSGYAPVSLNSGYNVVVGPTGTSWVNPAPVAWERRGAELAYPISGAMGQFRLVAAGLEVVNTTPELYKGGAVTCYRSPSFPSHLIATVFTAGPTNYAQNVTVYSIPPLTQTEAQLYPTAKTWAAEDGVYTVATQSGVENNYLRSTPSVAMMIRPANSANMMGNLAEIAYIDKTPIFVGSVGPLPLGQVLPFDSHGAFFTGLNPNATLQVTVKYYIERIPTVSEPDLLVLTRRSPDYDPMALEIYTHTLAQLPVGVKVGENPLGEWFDDVLGVVADFAAPLGTVFGPMGALAGNAVAGGARNWLGNRQTERRGGAPPLPPRIPRQPRLPPPPGWGDRSVQPQPQTNMSKKPKRARKRKPKA